MICFRIFMMSNMLLTILMAPNPISNERIVEMMSREFVLNQERTVVCVLNVNSGTSVGMESTNAMA